MATRYVLGLIETLDPVRDATRVLALSRRWHFHRDADLALDLALLAACAMPPMASLWALAPAGAASPEVRQLRGLVAQLKADGLYSRAGTRRLRRLLAWLAASALGPDDLLYLVCVFATEERRFNARFGWRAWTAHEKIAAFKFWREAAQALGLPAIPADIEEMEAYRRAYENSRRRFSPIAAQLARLLLADATRGLKPLPRAIARARLLALLDPALREALGLRAGPAAPLLRLALRIGARWRAGRGDPHVPAIRRQRGPEASLPSNSKPQEKYPQQSDSLGKI